MEFPHFDDRPRDDREPADLPDDMRDGHQTPGSPIEYDEAEPPTVCLSGRTGDNGEPEPLPDDLAPGEVPDAAVAPADPSPEEEERRALAVPWEGDFADAVVHMAGTLARTGEVREPTASDQPEPAPAEANVAEDDTGEPITEAAVSEPTPQEPSDEALVPSQPVLPPAHTHESSGLDETHQDRSGLLGSADPAVERYIETRLGELYAADTPAVPDSSEPGGSDAPHEAPAGADAEQSEPVVYPPTQEGLLRSVVDATDLNMTYAQPMADARVAALTLRAATGEVIITAQPAPDVVETPAAAAAAPRSMSVYPGSNANFPHARVDYAFNRYGDYTWDVVEHPRDPVSPVTMTPERAVQDFARRVARPRHSGGPEPRRLAGEEEFATPLRFMTHAQVLNPNNEYLPAPRE